MCQSPTAEATNRESDDGEELAETQVRIICVRERERKCENAFETHHNLIKFVRAKIKKTSTARELGAQV